MRSKSDIFVVTKTGAVPLYNKLAVAPCVFLGVPTGTGLPSNNKHCDAHERTSGSKRNSSKNETLAFMMSSKGKLPESLVTLKTKPLKISFNGLRKTDFPSPP